MVISDADGRAVARSYDGATPLVGFTPMRDGKYTISVKLQRCRRDASFCALAILRDGGWDVPLENLVRAVARSMQGCQSAGQFGFNAQRNQWCLYGAVMRGGGEVGVKNLRLGRGRHAIMAVGDDYAEDIDLYLSDSVGNKVGKDDAPDATPGFSHRAAGGVAYEVRIKVARSRGPTIVLATVLDFP